jgi:hypothetical protein
MDVNHLMASWRAAVPTIGMLAFRQVVEVWRCRSWSRRFKTRILGARRTLWLFAISKPEVGPIAPYRMRRGRPTTQAYPD